MKVACRLQDTDLLQRSHFSCFSRKSILSSHEVNCYGAPEVIFSFLQVLQQS